MRIRCTLKQFRQREDGGVLVELAVVLPIFFLIFFMLIDYGRMSFHYVNVEKAVQVAARVASVRPAACTGVPNFITRGDGDGVTAPRTGTQCNAAQNVCAPIATVTCTGAAENPTVSEIWALIDGAFPNDATEANLRFTYQDDVDLGFLGGPYVPVVTVEVTGLDFEFVNPLAGFIALAGGGGSNAGATVTFPGLSVSLPGEDLAQGVEG